MIPWCIEALLIVVFVYSLAMYKKMTKEKKTPTVPGACLDMSALTAIFLPLFTLVAHGVKLGSLSQTVGVVFLAVLGITYGLCLVMDISILRRNYRTNMKAKAEREKYFKTHKK